MTTEPNQADIMAAMAAGSFRSKPAANTSLYSDISDSSSLTQEAEGSKSKTNARKIYCFREGCGSVILQKGAAVYVESPSTIVCLSIHTRSAIAHISFQMTLHHLLHPQTKTHMDSGTFQILMHLTILDFRDPILLPLSPYRLDYQEMMERRGRGKR